MKKIICIILALCTLFLVSCKGEKPPAGTEEPKKDEWVTPNDYMDERFIYMGIERYDTEERVVTALCPDPLCGHGESCVMKNAGDIVLITEKYIYFRSTLGAKKYTRYDKLNNKYEEFFAAEGQCGYAFLVGDDIYLCASEYEYADTGELIGEVWHMYLAENEGAPVKITAEPLPSSVMIHSYNLGQGKIVAYFESTFFETDSSFSYIEYCERPQISHGGYYYKMSYNKADPQKPGTWCFKYERTSVETGETELIVDNAEVIRIIENAESEFEGIAWTDKNGVAYYKSFDGGTSNTWDFGDDYTVHNILLGNNHAQAGEWFLVGVAKWQKDEQGNFVLNEAGNRAIGEWYTMAFNFATGETFEFKE